VKPIVTIGVCVKNNEATIKEVVTSIVNQDFPHELIEVLVVDGFSKDKTETIIKEIFSKTSIQVALFSENIGLGFARQIVVDNAKGKYIIWVDGDVTLSKTYVKQQINLMENHPEAAIAIGKMGIIPDENWIALLENIGYVIESLKHDGTPTSKLLGTRGSILRVEAIRKIGGFDQNMISQEDTDVAYRLYKTGWKFFTTKAFLFERQKIKLKAVWRRYTWYGYGLHYLKHKHKRLNLILNKPNDRIIISSKAYKLTNRRIVFLLPFAFLFRRIALGFGFLRAHFEGYGHLK
jgi:glycosyltransferase involved in cell wall biosynthesis